MPVALSARNICGAAFCRIRAWFLIAIALNIVRFIAAIFRFFAIMLVVITVCGAA